MKFDSVCISENISNKLQFDRTMSLADGDCEGLHWYEGSGGTCCWRTSPLHQFDLNQKIKYKNRRTDNLTLLHQRVIAWHYSSLFPKFLSISAKLRSSFFFSFSLLITVWLGCCLRKELGPNMTGRKIFKSFCYWSNGII